MSNFRYTTHTKGNHIHSFFSSFLLCALRKSKCPRRRMPQLMPTCGPILLGQTGSVCFQNSALSSWSCLTCASVSPPCTSSGIWKCTFKVDCIQQVTGVVLPTFIDFTLGIIC